MRCIEQNAMIYFRRTLVLDYTIASMMVIPALDNICMDKSTKLTIHLEIVEYIVYMHIAGV